MAQIADRARAPVASSTSKPAFLASWTQSANPNRPCALLLGTHPGSRETRDGDVS
jgi:hypothetical protein